MAERTFNIPLRKEFMKVPRYKRAKKASKALFDFLTRHMKSAEVRIGSKLNSYIWKNGIQNPPHHVKVHALKDEKGIVRAELVGFPIELEKKPEKVKLTDRLGITKPGKKVEEAEKPAGEKASEAVQPADTEAKSETQPATKEKKSPKKKSTREADKTE